MLLQLPFLVRNEGCLQAFGPVIEEMNQHILWFNAVCQSFPFHDCHRLKATDEFWELASIRLLARLTPSQAYVAGVKVYIDIDEHSTNDETEGSSDIVQADVMRLVDDVAENYPQLVMLISVISRESVSPFSSVQYSNKFLHHRDIIIIISVNVKTPDPRKVSHLKLIRDRNQPQHPPRKLHPYFEILHRCGIVPCVPHFSVQAVYFSEQSSGGKTG